MNDPLPMRARAEGDGASVRSAVLLLIAFFATVAIRTAWVADQAFGDLRTVANVVAGHGLRWNVDERVQAFTDPLWVLLLSAVTVIVRQPYAAVLVTSLALSVWSVIILATRIAVDPLAALIGLALLTFSCAFVEYATSGFQTPLVYALLALFWAAYLRRQDDGRMRGRLLLMASLCLLTDWTAVLLLAPALGTAVMTSQERRTRGMAAAAAPVLLWALFALFYYGVLVPSPIVAGWRDLGPVPAMMRQGGVYLLDAIDRDPLTILAIGIAATHGFGVRRLRPIAAGLVLYVVALIASGGEAMSGRALAPALLTAAVIVTQYPWRAYGQLFLVPLCGVVAIGLIAPDSPVLTGPTYRASEPLGVSWPQMEPAIAPGRAAIRDARRDSYPATGLLTMHRTRPMPDLIAFNREVDARSAQARVVVEARAGMFAYAAGARLHIVDPAGRSDSFVARLRPEGDSAPGPRRRAVPATYVAALEQGAAVDRADPLNKLSARLALAARGALLDPKRLKAIVLLNLGLGAR